MLEWTLDRPYGLVHGRSDISQALRLDRVSSHCDYPHVMLSVADLLTLPVFEAARPVIETGESLEQLAGCPVRWVHTSEIYEISPLLKGGEVLLTTGLGLIAASEDVRRDYATDLGKRGVAALFLELGRTFSETPPEIVSAAREAGLPVISMSGVVPFVEVTETVHTLLISSEVDELRFVTRLDSEMAKTVAGGGGLPGVLASLSDAVECATGLYLLNGTLIAGTTAADNVDLSDPSLFASPILVGGEAWATLVLEGSRSPRREVAVERVSPFLALEATRSKPASSRQLAGGELLWDIDAGRYSSLTELTQRARGVGLSPKDGQQVIAIVLEVGGKAVGKDSLSDVIAAREAAFAALGPATAAEVDGRVSIAAVAAAGNLRSRLNEFADLFDRYMKQSGRRSYTAAVAPPVKEIAGLPEALSSAKATLLLARRLTPAARLVLSEDFALYQLLANTADDAALADFVQSQLGPLLEHDSRTGSELLHTLDVYLDESLSKAAAAGRLSIRRQTLYSRLERISALLGGADLSSRERRIAIDLALVAWKLRSAGATASRH